MTRREELLEKYYRGESSLDEERELKQLAPGNELPDAEQDMLDFFGQEAVLPDGLEEELMRAVEKRRTRSFKIRRLTSMGSAAAVILIVLTVFLDVRNKRISKMENDFRMMEQALLQVSESLQPEEQKQMLVLWVDDDVEIVIN
ncbi:hypothetical protein INQ51_17240 [Maribellus sp. CM-23]|uniref:hypothetical protein n=1 Tax=Maribellus sp. CM-23 TaxID=2781026 RepID=UPI001F17B7F1|nr:hypothetical protein [Maribellus sp. CM-23]MCE4566067.1 hypothetical protein [Maribellus sp. CM-23]